MLRPDGFHRPSVPVNAIHQQTAPTEHVPLWNQAQPQQRKKLILCFDGTGNKFKGDETDSNILKIFRMLDRSTGDQYHYYQPGIGTYITSTSLSHTSLFARVHSWYMKGLDSAVGTSFDQHVIGGYKFLMRYYHPGDDIYLFGFSRGAYTARFLAEMLDYVGLVTQGNEEMVRFAWKTFSQWQQRHGGDEKEDKEKKKQMFDFMKAFRETFTRPVKRIRFLGLFDTVNSVPRFEAAWMQRSKYPYTARSSAKVIRHAVSIDERRAKFRQDLVSQEGAVAQRKAEHEEKHRSKIRRPSIAQPQERGRIPSTVNEGSEYTNPDIKMSEDFEEEEEEARQQRYRPTSRSRMRSRSPNPSGGRASYDRSPRSRSPNPEVASQDFAATDSLHSFEIHHDEDADSDDETGQDVEEVWFAGGHGDIGGGWNLAPGEAACSHAPLVWIVKEAKKAGLTFDDERVRAMGCMDDEWGNEAFEDWMKPHKEGSGIPNIQISVPEGSDDGQEKKREGPSLQTNGERKGLTNGATNGHENHTLGQELSEFAEMLHKVSVKSVVHDSLAFGGGLAHSSVLSWRIMEYLPFRRMDLQPDGSWKPIRWPLPGGEVRDIPEDAKIHNSVIKRMKHDPSYRPGNLIVGGGGRGVRVAPEEYGIGEWVIIKDEGSPIGEIWMRKSAWEKKQLQVKTSEK